MWPLSIFDDPIFANTSLAVLTKFRINYYRRLEPKTMEQPKCVSAVPNRKTRQKGQAGSIQPLLEATFWLKVAVVPEDSCGSGHKLYWVVVLWISGVK